MTALTGSMLTVDNTTPYMALRVEGRALVSEDSVRYFPFTIYYVNEWSAREAFIGFVNDTLPEDWEGEVRSLADWDDIGPDLHRGDSLSKLLASGYRLPV